MSPLCQQYEDDWDLLALAALDPERALDLRAHLAAGCVVCRQRYGESLAASRALAHSVPDAVPSAEVERLLRGRIQRSVGARPQAVYPRAGYWPWAAVAASLMLAGWLGWDRAELAARLAQVQQPRESIAVVEAGRPASRAATPAVAAPAPVAAVAPKDSDLAALRAQVDRLQAILRAAEEISHSAREEAQREQTRLEDARAEATERARRSEKSLRQAEAQLASSAVPSAISPARSDESLVQLARVKDELGAASRALDTQGKQLAEYRRVFRALEGAALRQVDMQSVDPSGGRATARAVFSSDGLIVFARDLPKLPPGKCYQLWIVRRGGPAIVSGGLLQTDAQGRGVLVAASTPNLKDATGFAITDEPQGGSPSAQGKKLLFGAL